MEHRRLLVTGALGHIGSQFIRSIQPGEFDEVVLLDNLSTQRYCSLFNLPAGVPYRFVEADVLGPDFERHLKGMDVVVHLAAITNAAGSFEIQDEVERVNLVGTQRVAAACAEHGARLVFLSTTSVYGTQAAVVDENCRPDELKPQSPYATSKLKAEQALADLARTLGLRHVACRFGTIFGTSIGMRFHTAINKFCWQASVGEPITVWRTALNQRRPYLALDDAVRALRFIIGHDVFDGEIYNVLTVNTTVGEIVTAIRSHIADVRIDYVDTPIMNQLSYTVANDKFRARGFEVRGSLERGIMETLELIRNVRVSPVTTAAM
jgi:nucleoside-diphosphate-sugar epimerase